jgi:hypothetical protein
MGARVPRFQGPTAPFDAERGKGILYGAVPVRRARFVAVVTSFFVAVFPK